MGENTEFLKNSAAKTRILFRGLFAAAILIVIVILAACFLTWRVNQDVNSISVSTDKQEYQVGDIVRISIQNSGDGSVDIYCLESCALGNFPTTVEKSVDGAWQYFAGFCPSIEPLFGNRVYKGDYIRHTLPAKSSFELEISNFESLRLTQGERLRVVYYAGFSKRPIYSNEFSVGP